MARLKKLLLDVLHISPGAPGRVGGGGWVKVCLCVLYGSGKVEYPKGAMAVYIDFILLAGVWKSYLA